MGQTARHIRKLLGLALATAALLPAGAQAATFTVAELDDPPLGACTSDEVGTDTCSLREAVLAANDAAGHDTIVLSGAVTLTIAGADEDDGEFGDLDVTDDLTIEGPAEVDPPLPPGSINANSLDRVIDVPVGGPDLTLEEITVNGGLVSTAGGVGGGIRFNGGTPASELDLVEVSLTNNRAESDAAGVAKGGGLWAGSTGAGIAHVSVGGESLIAGNTAGGVIADREGYGGGIAIEGPAGQQLGVGASTITSNAAGGGPTATGGAGGAIYAETSGASLISVTASNLQGNTAGLSSDTAPSIGMPAANGGAISAQGSASVSVTGGTITGNKAGSGADSSTAPAAGGAIAKVGPGSVAISGTSIQGNRAGGDGGVGAATGGAIHAESALTLNGGNLTGNHAGGGGISSGQGIYMEGTGALGVNGTAFTGNGTSNVGNGGAISDNANGNMTITGATFTSNPAAHGGAIFRQGSGDDQIATSTFTGNSASGSDGGGAYFSSAGTNLLISRSTFNGNLATGGDGAALSLRNAVEAENVTISGNTAADDGGGVYVDTSGSFDAELSTFAENSAASEGGNIYAQDTDGDVNLLGSIITGGTAPTGSNCFQTSPGVINSAGYNIESTDQCGLDDGGDLPDTDPQIGPLAANGGPTQTRRPSNLGPAVDLVPAGDCSPPTDQRGRSRPNDLNGDGIEACEAGSVELQAPSVSSLRTSPGSGANNNFPKIQATTDLTALVGVYTVSDCSGTPLASGTGADLAGAGIEVHVPDNSTRTFYVRVGVLNEGVSPCLPVTYSEVTPPLDPGPPGFKPPVKHKCKKRKKLKKVKGKFKCVKKKKKRPKK
jgi:predicted outer membrane repeat protein